MWKNKIHNKKLNIYTRYEVEGRNIHALINILKNNKIEIKRLKFAGDNKIYISVSICDNKKFFAILNELCYNVKEIKKHGLGYPFFFIYKNLGLALGTLFFIILTCISNNFIFAISFKGSGSIYENQILNKLNEDGIKIFKNFNSFDLKKEAEKILKSNSNLIFVSLEKQGNYLVVNSSIKQDDKEIGVEKEKIISPCNGTIEEIKLYRGEQLKQVGDVVKIGEPIIVGKEYQNYKGNVIASIKIICDYNFVYESEKDLEEDEVICFAKEILNRETLSEKIHEEKIKQGYKYSVELKYRIIVS